MLATAVKAWVAMTRASLEARAALQEMMGKGSADGGVVMMQCDGMQAEASTQAARRPS